MNDLPEQMVRNAWMHAEHSWFLPPRAAEHDGDDLDNSNAADNDDDELDDVNAADNVDDELDNNKSNMEEKDTKSSSLFFSSGIEDKIEPPLASTHDFFAALESNANQGISNQDSKATTLSI